jgi:CelD/BcsL family acetyltransferase involved in cellulose biosynthesis
LRLLPSDWEEFHLPGLDCARFPGTGVLRPLDGYTVEFDKDVPSPYVDLQAVRQANDGYLSLVSSNTRSQVRRAYRGYEAQGPIRTQAADNLSEAMQIYEELVVLHQQAWRTRSQPGAFASAYFDRFHRELIRKRFSQGEIQLLRMTAGPETVGCLYNFLYQGRVYFYQSGMRYESDPKLKPGLVCHTEAIQFNAAQSHQVYDFLGGAARYKSSLATHSDRLVWARIQKPRAKFWIESRLRRAKRALAGAGMKPATTEV